MPSSPENSLPAGEAETQRPAPSAGKVQSEAERYWSQFNKLALSDTGDEKLKGVFIAGVAAGLGIGSNLLADQIEPLIEPYESRVPVNGKPHRRRSASPEAK